MLKKEIGEKLKGSFKNTRKKNKNFLGVKSCEFKNLLKRNYKF